MLPLMGKRGRAATGPRARRRSDPALCPHPTPGTGRSSARGVATAGQEPAEGEKIVVTVCTPLEDAPHPA
jgi:hypothetical protein